MMSRKAMDRLNGFDSRQAIWDEIRRHGKDGFTVRELRDSTTLQTETVREFVTGLVNAGYLTILVDALDPDHPVLKDKAGAILYALVKNVGIDAPRVRKDGTPVTQGQGTANMWHTMWILGTFSVRELAVTASIETCVIKEATAERYLRHLCEAGYLRQTKGRYRLLPYMHTGSKPPMIQRVKRVWDQNLKMVMWSEEQVEGQGLKAEGGGDYDQ
jgi:hypothetical protein